MATESAPNSSDLEEPKNSLTEEAAIAALVVLLLSDLPEAELTARAQAVLAPLGVAADAAEAAVLLGVAAMVPRAPGVAASWVARTQPARRAAFVLHSARRATEGSSSAAERVYLAQHLAAERARVFAAGLVDREASKHGPVLGWYARRDGATTLGCLAAHGSNFRADRPPRLGWPATLHGGACRCRPGPPWPDGTMLD